MNRNYEVHNSDAAVKKYLEDKDKPLGSAKEYVNNKYMQKIKAIGNLADLIAIINYDDYNVGDVVKFRVATRLYESMTTALDELQSDITNLFGLANETDKDLSDVVSRLQESFLEDTFSVLSELKKLESKLNKLNKQIENSDRQVPSSAFTARAAEPLVHDISGLSK